MQLSCVKRDLPRHIVPAQLAITWRFHRWLCCLVGLLCYVPTGHWWSRRFFISIFSKPGSLEARSLPTNLFQLVRVYECVHLMAHVLYITFLSKCFCVSVICICVAAAFVLYA